MFQTSLKKQYKFLLPFLIFILYSVVFPQANNPVTYKILGISVEGNKTADVNTIIVNSGLKVGDEIQIPGDQTLNAIKNLWNLNIFSDIQVLEDKKVGDGIFLTIRVTEYPRIEKTVIVGNDELSTSDIEEKIHFGRGQILTPEAVNNLKLRIIKMYEDDGYLNAVVEPKYYVYLSSDTSEDNITVTWRNEKDFSDEYKLDYERDDASSYNLIPKIKDRILLKININENDRVVVRHIEFEGNKAFDEGDLKGAMDEISEAKWWKFWNSAKFDKTKFDKDKKSIKDFYLKNGYRDAEIISDSLIYSNHKKDLAILINVYEGPQYKVRNIIWEGNTIYPDEVLSATLDFKKGDIFNYEKFQRNLRGNETQTDVTSLYLDNGYLTFNLDESENKIGNDSIDIDIKIDEKNQFKIGRVDILGNDKTKDKVIRRELYSIPGDYFNRALLIRSIQQLANLKYFNVEKLYGADAVNYKLANDSTVNVSFQVEEKSSDYLNASVGYSGSFGFSGAVGITLTNFALDKPFSLGGGQILSFSWQFGVGSIYRTFTLGFTEPWLFDTPTLLGFEVFDTREQYIYDLRQSGGTIRLGRRLKWPDDFFNVQGFFRYQYNNVLNGQGYYPIGISHQYTLGATISRKDIDNPIFPSKGSSLAISGELSGGPFLPGDVDYYKLGFTSEWYKRLFNSNRIALYTIANLGYLQELNEATKLKINPFDKYYMGGNGLVIATEPLRGYDDRTIGPRNSAGQVIGGRVMERFTAELRFAVTLEPMPLYILAFAEAGNVFESFNKTDIFNLRRSAGFGARILINPIGLIGFDLGYGFDRKAVDGNDPSWLFHFQFGKGF
jgi:outer membrane protein insertion porin family